MATRTLCVDFLHDAAQELTQDGYRLYVFRPVVSSNRSGVPLVWSSRNCLPQVFVNYDSELTAYLSTALADTGHVTIGDSRDVTPGQVVQVGPAGITGVRSGGTPGAVAFLSDAEDPYTCGLAAMSDGVCVPYAAFTLHPSLEVDVTPLDGICVLVTTSTYDAGTVMPRALGPGLMVSFDGTASRSISYDIDRGWATNGAVWASLLAAGDDLRPALIRRPPDNVPT